MPKKKQPKIHDFKPDPKNARIHNDRNKKAIIESLREFGAARSIVVDADGIVRAGNGTFEAAKEAGIQKVQVVDADGESLIVVRRNDLRGEAAAAYGIVDNRTAELADWDPNLLNEVLQGLEETEKFSDLEKLGFSEIELEGMFEFNDENENIPEDNQSVDEEKLAETKYTCPSCGFKW